MTKIFFVCQFLLLITIGSIAQNTGTDSTFTKNNSASKHSKWINFTWGGYLTFQVGTVTIIDVSPQVGYYFKPWLLVGSGFTYEYYSQKWYTQRISSSIFGLRTFNELTFFTSKSKHTAQKPKFSFFTHLEYEALNLDRDFTSLNTSINQTNRFWIHGILIGGGFKQIFGKRSSFNVVILYNILNDKRTPYDNPQLRIGFYL